MNPSLQPLASTILYSICMNSATLGTSYCNHIVFVFFVTGLFHLECLQIHPHVSISFLFKAD